MAAAWASSSDGTESRIAPYSDLCASPIPFIAKGGCKVYFFGIICFFCVAGLVSWDTNTIPRNLLFGSNLGQSLVGRCDARL